MGNKTMNGTRTEPTTPAIVPEIAKKQEGVQKQSMPAPYAGPWTYATRGKAIGDQRITLSVSMDGVGWDKILYLAERELARMVQDWIRRQSTLKGPMLESLKRDSKASITFADLEGRLRVQPDQTPQQLINKLLLICGGDKEKALELLDALGNK